MMKSDSENSNPINETLGLDKQSPGYKKAKVWVISVIVTVFIACVVIFFIPKNNVSLQYKTAQVQQGQLVVFSGQIGPKYWSGRTRRGRLISHPPLVDIR